LVAQLQANALPRTATQCPELCGAGLLNAVRSAVPPLQITVVLDPDRALGVGETTTARASVTRGGAPEAGIAVAFSTDDPAIATVTASAVTDGSGVAVATVTGVRRGETTVFASVNGVTASTPVRVPTLETLAVVALALALIVTGLLRRRTAVA
jgi:hypothetical protein